MKAEEKTINNILTEQICYSIPPYQRPYSWKKDNVNHLLDDLWGAYTSNDDEYFVGALITIERKRNAQYEVVDGQQRLTTLNLIFSRLRDHIEDAAAKAELGNRILPRNVLIGGTKSPRLLLRQKDQNFFRKHVLESQPVADNLRAKLEAPQLRIVENIEEIDSFIKGKNEKVLREFANYILTKVYFVFVTTDSWTSAFRMFNVLNARGLKLSNSDLIKNTLFRSLGTEISRSDELEDRWVELEEQLGIDQLDTFFGHHRTSLVASKANRSLHLEYESVIENSDGGPFDFMDKIIDSATNYMRIIDSSIHDVGAVRALRALHRVEYDEWTPPLLAYFNAPVPDLSESDFIKLLEKITMQNWIRRLGRTARMTVYFQLINAINAKRDKETVLNIFKKNAHNEEFLSLLNGDVYGKPFDLAVLLRLEEAIQDESVSKEYNGRITIEHILPQALKDEYWKSRFDEAKHIHWLHRLGNIALLSGNKNYKAQYYGFDRKKQIYNERNKKVSFDLTKELLEIPDWDEGAISTRQNRLVKIASDIWSIK